MISNLATLKKELHKQTNKKKAAFLQKYFKTGEGEYGAGDTCLGIPVPVQRKIAKQYVHLPLNDIQNLLKSTIHEYRFTALEILVFKYEKASESEKTKIVKFYVKNKKYINNWDLVDTSAPYILGHYLFKKPKNILIKFARSKNIWDRRISIISTFYFIKQGEYKQSLIIATILLNDTHDLIHKAVGWMLKEIGNKSLATEEAFLNKYYKNMPRTMLRYSIEKFPPAIRKKYLDGKI